MNVKIISKRTVNFGCIKGDWNRIKNVSSIEDRGDHWELVINKNWSRYVRKEDWEIIREE